jgi:hypothetical protein
MTIAALQLFTINNYPKNWKQGNISFSTKTKNPVILRVFSFLFSNYFGMEFAYSKIQEA